MNGTKKHHSLHLMLALGHWLHQHLHNPCLRLTHRSKVAALRKDSRQAVACRPKTAMLTITPALAYPLVRAQGNIIAHAPAFV
jgi:hypothetical protein